MWVWVNLPYACYGIKVAGGRVLSAPPIAKWMTGKDTKYIQQWIRSKGGEWKVLHGL